jgi:hypothetical protein
MRKLNQPIAADLQKNGGFKAEAEWQLSGEIFRMEYPGTIQTKPK